MCWRAQRAKILPKCTAVLYGATTGNSQDHRQRPKAYTMRVYPGGCTSPAQPSQRHDGNTGRSRGPPPPAGNTKTAIASVFTGPSSCVNAFKRAVNAFGEAALVNCDLPTEPDTIKIFQKSASLAQNLRIKICGEMNQNPGLGQMTVHRRGRLDYGVMGG